MKKTFFIYVAHYVFNSNACFPFYYKQILEIGLSPNYQPILK